MKLRKIFRNKITGFLFGKYQLEDEVKKYLIPWEEYIAGIEIIYYNEMLYLVSFLLFVISTSLAIFFHPLFLLLVVIPLYLIYTATRLELIFLTNERIIIEKRTWFEKVFKTSNIQTVVIDQIAVLSYARAPLNYPGLLFGSLITILGLVPIFILDIVFFNLFLTFVGSFATILVGSYLFVWSLRLNKRSIELYIIGVRGPIGIGREKGAVLWFLEEIQQIVFERVHHVFHTDEPSKADVTEFPLEYSGVVKKLIDKIENPLQKQILLLLDKGNLPKRQIVVHLGNATKEEIDLAMRQLRRQSFIFYDRSQNKWCLNKKYIYNREMGKQDNFD